jgi:hypothetical protein
MENDDELKTDTDPASHDEQVAGTESRLTLELQTSLLNDCVAMVDHARLEGIAVPPAVLQSIIVSLDAFAAKKLVDAVRLMQDHNTLSELVKPATPSSIVYIKTQKARQRFFRMLGPIPTIRDMVIVAIVSLICFLILASSGKINSEEMTKSFFERTGYGEIVISTFLLASAAIGVSFANLYKAYQYAINGSYDPKYDATYWIRFVLGLIAGLILAELLTLDIGDQVFQKPLLALLGGFSASAVFRILNKMVEAVESVFQGDKNALVAGREAEIKSRLERQVALQRVELSKDLMDFRERLKNGGNVETFGPELDKMIKKIIG